MIVGDIYRFMLTEISKLDDKFFGPLEAAIEQSEFWFEENHPDDIDVNSVDGNWVEQTPAAEALGEVLQEFFDEVSFPISVVVGSLDPTENPAVIIGKGHPVYPNGVVISGNAAVSNRGRFVLRLSVGLFGNEFNVDDVSPVSIAAKTARLVRHELIHTTQVEKRRKSQKISRSAAAKKYTEEGETPGTTDRKSYLSAKIEVDAYAHEIAEELLSKLGPNDALDLLRGRIDPARMDLADQTKEYFVDFANEPFTVRLKKKVYAQIMDLISRGIY